MKDRVSSRRKKAQASPMKSEITRQRILDAAAEVFSHEGYSNARLTDVARRAGIQTGSLYYHFASRDDLVDEILRLGIEKSWRQVLEALETLPDDADAMTRLATALHAQTRSVLDSSAYASAQARISGQVPGPVRERHLADQRRYGSFWNELVTAAIADGQVDADFNPFIARALALGAMNRTAEWYRPNRDVAAESVATDAVAMILRGLASEDQPRAEIRPSEKPRASEG